MNGLVDIRVRDVRRLLTVIFLETDTFLVKRSSIRVSCEFPNGTKDK